MRPPPCSGTLKCHAISRSTESPARERPGQVDSHRGAEACALDLGAANLQRLERAATGESLAGEVELLPRKTSGGWLSILVMLVGSQRFCSTNSQRYGKRVRRVVDVVNRAAAAQSRSVLGIERGGEMIVCPLLPVVRPGPAGSGPDFVRSRQCQRMEPAMNPPPTRPRPGRPVRPAKSETEQARGAHGSRGCA